MNPPKPTVGDDAEKRADAVILSWINNRVSMRFQRDAIADAIRDAVTDALCSPDVVCVNVCSECKGSGYAVHPQNGFVKGKRCSRGCRVNCSICNDPNCDNPGGQH